jgi:hypothetical protein
MITDGNQNVGDAIEQGRALAEAGIGIDVVPIHSQAQSDVAVEKVIMSSDVRRGQPFEQFEGDGLPCGVVVRHRVNKHVSVDEGRLRIIQTWINAGHTVLRGSSGACRWSRYECGKIL